MTPNQKWNVPGSSQPIEPTAQQSEEIPPSSKKPKTEPTPSQVGKFQAAVGQPSKKKGFNLDQELIPTKEETESMSEESLFGLAHTSMKKPISAKPGTKGQISKSTVGPLPSAVGGTGEQEVESEGVETIGAITERPARKESYMTPESEFEAEIEPSSTTSSESTIKTVSKKPFPTIYETAESGQPKKNIGETSKPKEAPFFATGSKPTTVEGTIPPKEKHALFGSQLSPNIEQAKEFRTRGMPTSPGLSKEAVPGMVAQGEAQALGKETKIPMPPKGQPAAFGKEAKLEVPQKGQPAPFSQRAVPEMAPKGQPIPFGQKVMPEMAPKAPSTTFGTRPTTQTTLPEGQKTISGTGTSSIVQAKAAPMERQATPKAQEALSQPTTESGTIAKPKQKMNVPKMGVSALPGEETEEEAPTSLVADVSTEGIPLVQEELPETSFEPKETTTSKEESPLPLAASVAKEKGEKAKMEKTLPKTIQQPIPTPTPQPQITSKGTQVSPEVRQATLQQLINQIAEHISTMTTKHLETLTVDIKYPPLFAGAQLTVTQYKQARGEFNLSFANLTPEARLLIESSAQQQRLNDALTEKGYKIHIITIETHPIERPTFEAQASGSSREGYEEAGSGGAGGEAFGEEEYQQPGRQ